MKKTTFFCCLTLFLCHFSYAQKESNIWFFGRDGVGLDFNCIPPSVITGHAMIGWEGVATICDRNTGKVLFYTNGDRIFGSDHVELPDGTNITPLSASFEPLNTVTQVLPIPFPGNPEQYFVVATDVQGGKFSSANSSQNGVWAVRIDMAENNGLGAVVDRFQLYNPLFASEKLMAVPHENGQDYFLIGHEFGTDRFFVSKVDQNGIQIPPVTQAIGAVHSDDPNDFDNLNALGELKASPDGKRLASVISGDQKIELFDFDNNTGILSNAIELGTEEGVFGVSFSPDNSKLYVGTWTGKLIQFDVSLSNANDIIASRLLIYDYQGGCFGSLKIAPDLKIYVSRYQGGPFEQDGGDTFLGIINNPNEAGTNANYVHDGIDLEGRKCNWGLNNLIEQITFQQIELSVDLGDDVVGDCEDNPFLLNAENDCAEYLWQDGSMQATFEVTVPGTYFVDVIYGNCVVSDTMNYDILSEIDISLGEDQTICANEIIVLDATVPNGTYEWQDGSTTSTFSVTTSGIYSVRVTNSCGSTSDEIEIIVEEEFELSENFRIPNIFTPNGDNINEIFRPFFNEALFEYFSNVEFSVYSRWGEKVFSSQDILNGWDGNFKNEKSPSDVYIWTFQATVSSCSGEFIEIFEKGDVTLVR